jgi:hypothetical protein
MTSPTPQTPTAQTPTAPREERAYGEARVLRLHTAHPRVPIPYVTPGDMMTNARTVASAIPSPRRLAFYGGLGALAIFGALEWPVAAAIGAATEVIARERGERHERAMASGTPGEERTPATGTPAQQRETPRATEAR